MCVCVCICIQINCYRANVSERNRLEKETVDYEIPDGETSCHGQTACVRMGLSACVMHDSELVCVSKVCVLEIGGLNHQGGLTEVLMWHLTRMHMLCFFYVFFFIFSFSFKVGVVHAHTNNLSFFSPLKYDFHSFSLSFSLSFFFSLSV